MIIIIRRWLNLLAMPILARGKERGEERGKKEKMREKGRDQFSLCKELLSCWLAKEKAIVQGFLFKTQ